MTAAAAAVTVAGAGNWLLGHDRVGPRVLERARHRWGDEVELASLGTDPLALLDHLHRQRLLVVVDACVGLGEPGEIRVVEADLERPLGRETSVHQIGPIETLVVARHLWPELMPERTLLVMVETGDLDDHAEDELCERVVATLDRLLARCHSARPPAPPAPAAERLTLEVT